MILYTILFWIYGENAPRTCNLSAKDFGEALQKAAYEARGIKEQIRTVQIFTHQTP